MHWVCLYVNLFIIIRKQNFKIISAEQSRATAHKVEVNASSSISKPAQNKVSTNQKTFMLPLYEQLRKIVKLNCRRPEKVIDV